MLVSWKGERTSGAIEFDSIRSFLHRPGAASMPFDGNFARKRMRAAGLRRKSRKEISKSTNYLGKVLPKQSFTSMRQARWIVIDFQGAPTFAESGDGTLVAIHGALFSTEFTHHLA